MLHPDSDEPVSCWAWSLEQRLAYAYARIEKTMDRYPEIAQVWLTNVQQLEKQIEAEKTVDTS